MRTKLLLCCALLLVMIPACNLPANLPLLGPSPTVDLSKFGILPVTPGASPVPATTMQPLAPPVAQPTDTLIPLPTPTSAPALIPGERIQGGDQALNNGDWEKAVQEFQAVLDSGQAELQAAALLGLGRARLVGRNYYEAANALEKIIQDYSASPLVPEAYFTLGQVYSAQERYSEAAEAYLNFLILRPGVIDAYVLDLRGDALFAAGDYGGAAKDFQGAMQSPSQLDGEYLQLKTARAFAISGDSTTAFTLYDDLYYRTNNDYTRALIDLRKGQAYTEMGQPDQANAAYLDAVNNYPKAYESYSALATLVEAGVTVDELQRGIVDYYADQYGVALAAFDRYLQNNPADPATAQYFYGLAASALGSHEEAIQRWDIIIQNFAEHPYWDEAWEQKAYTQWAMLGQHAQATQTLLDFVQIVPAHPRAGEFLFDAALAAERGGDLAQSADLFERVINLYPGYENATRALFLAGLSQYRLGNTQQALLAFLRFQGITGALEDRAMVQFWIAKTQDAMGEKEAARGSFETAVGIDPTGYYSERARDILHGRTPFQPPETYDILYDIQTERQQAEDWIRATFGLAPEVDLRGLGSLASESSLQRGAELWKLGLYDEARAEFESLRLSVAADAAQSYRLGNFLVDLGVYRPAIMAMRQVLELAMMDDAATLGAPAYFNHVRFGTYYADLLIPLAQEYNFHPLFLFSLVRQESLFEGFVRSTAGAHGLMQIMPPTGADIARNLGWPNDYTDLDLGRPLVNVKFGVDYLDTQRSTFDGDLYAALAAYNGGPGNAAEWRALAPDDPDLFLEVIRYAETRKYIRGVYELFTLYRLIYGRVP